MEMTHQNLFDSLQEESKKVIGESEISNVEFIFETQWEEPQQDTQNQEEKEDNELHVK